MGAPSHLGFVLEQNFFGFNSKHQVQFHEQLFDLLWAGDGKWDWNTIYSLPIHIRKLWISKINKKYDHIENEQRAAEEKRSKQQNIIKKDR